MVGTPPRSFRCPVAYSGGRHRCQCSRWGRRSKYLRDGDPNALFHPINENNFKSSILPNEKYWSNNNIICSSIMI